jgi:TetR/AcrR family hemagglutinin/protease transcriptional regulator
MVDRNRNPQARKRAPRLSPDQRRTQLLGCAMRVFAHRGIAWARPAEVAAAAGVSESTVFVYFITRDDLVAAVLDEIERFYMEKNRHFLAAAPFPAPQAILQLGAAFAESVDSHPHHARVWLDWSNSSGEAIFPRYLDYQEQVIRLVTSTLQRGRAEGSVAADVIPEDAARILYGAAQMVVQLKLTGSSAATVGRFLVSATRAVIGCPVDDDAIPQRVKKMLSAPALSDTTTNKPKRGKRAALIRPHMT